MTAAGYDVTLDEFPFVYLPPATLQQLTPVVATYETGRLHGHGLRRRHGRVTPVDINLGPAAGLDERLRGRGLRRLPGRATSR